MHTYSRSRTVRNICIHHELMTGEITCRRSFSATAVGGDIILPHLSGNSTYSLTLAAAAKDPTTGRVYQSPPVKVHQAQLKLLGESSTLDSTTLPSEMPPTRGNAFSSQTCRHSTATCSLPRTVWSHLSDFQNSIARSPEEPEGGQTNIELTHHRS